MSNISDLTNITQTVSSVLGIVSLIVSLITVIIIYSLYKSDSVKQAFIVRILSMIAVGFLNGNLVSLWNTTKFINNGLIIFIIAMIIIVIFTALLNILEYKIAYNFTISFVGFCIVSYAIYLVLTIFMTGAVVYIANIFKIGGIL